MPTENSASVPTVVDRDGRDAGAPAQPSSSPPSPPTGPAARAAAGPTLPTPAEWAAMRETAAVLVASGFLSKAVDTPEKAMAIILKGHELGLPAMVAFEHISVIDGKPSLSAKLTMAQIRRHVPGAKVEVLEYTNERVMIRASRPGQRPIDFTWTPEDARRAELVHDKKPNWQRYTRAMLRSRCVTEMASTLFPEALMGFSVGAAGDDEDLDLAGDEAELPPREAARRGALPPATAQAALGAARQDRAPAAPPRTEQPRQARADARGPTIYTGSPDDQRMLHAVAKGKSFPEARFGELHDAMLNRPLADGGRVVAELLARGAAGGEA